MSVGATLPLVRLAGPCSPRSGAAFSIKSTPATRGWSRDEDSSHSGPARPSRPSHTFARRCHQRFPVRRHWAKLRLQTSTRDGRGQGLIARDGAIGVYGSGDLGWHKPTRQGGRPRHGLAASTARIGWPAVTARAGEGAAAGPDQRPSRPRREKGGGAGRAQWTGGGRNFPRAGNRLDAASTACRKRKIRAISPPQTTLPGEKVGIPIIILAHATQARTRSAQFERRTAENWRRKREDGARRTFFV